MAQDLLDHRPLQDGDDDPELPGAAVRAVLHVDVENPLKQPCPADASGPDLGGLGLALDAGCGNAWHFLILGRPLRHHQRAQLGVRGQNPVEPDQVQPRPGNQRRQPLQELQRAAQQQASQPAGVPVPQKAESKGAASG